MVLKITEQEAIEAIKSNRPTSGYIVLCEALDMSVAALEKQIPKKTDTDGENNYYLCPECEEDLMGCYGDNIDKNPGYCLFCGQALLW